MNDTTPPPPPQTGGAPSAPPPGGFFAWLRGLRIVRGDDRWFAGVAGGIAARAGIDPLIVRGIFVVLALLGGPGILLYLAGWLLLPDRSGRIHAENIIRGRASAGMMTVAILIAVLVIIPALLSILLPSAPFFAAPALWGWDVWGVIGVPAWLSATIAWLCWITVLVLAFIYLRRYLLQRGRDARDQGRGASPTESSETPGGSGGPGGATFAAPAAGPASSTAPSPPSAPSTDSAPSFTDRTTAFIGQVGEEAGDWGEKAGAWGQQAGERAAKWGEDLGRRTDEWSVNYAERQERFKLGAGQTILTLALALLAAGGAALWTLQSSDAPSVPQWGEPHVALVMALTAALAVCAVSLIIAGVRGRYTGWVGFLTFCTAVALLFTAVLPWGSRFQPFGVAHVEADQSPGIMLIAGSSHVDLGDLDENDMPHHRGDANDDLVVWQLAGLSTVELPESEPAIVEVRLLAGNVNDRSLSDAGRSTAGPFISRTISANMDDEGGRSGTRNSDPMRVTVYLLAGNVNVVESGAKEEAR